MGRWQTGRPLHHSAALSGPPPHELRSQGGRIHTSLASPVYPGTMLHLSPKQSDSQPYAEAVSRLASVRHALRLVSPFGDGPAPDLHEDEVIAAAWDSAGPARQHLFGRRSERTVNAASAGVEALMIERDEGREPNWAASDALVEQIRRELRDVAGVVLG